MTLDKIDAKIAELEHKIQHAGEGTASTYTRITGYYRPTEGFNNGKKEEYVQRLEYNLSSKNRFLVG